MLQTMYKSKLKQKVVAIWRQLDKTERVFQIWNDDFEFIDITSI